MKNMRPENDAEEAMLRVLQSLYGNDALSFRFKGSEVVEAMAIAYQTGLDSPKETK